MAWDTAVMAESFLMTNISPQVAGLNRGEWEEGEAVTRAWAVERGDLVVMDGPIYEGAVKRFGKDQIAEPTAFWNEPTAFWKVIVDPGAGKAVALIMDNVAIRKGDLAPFAVPVAEIERRAGLSIPLPPTVDKAAVGALWPVNLAAFAKAKRSACEMTN